MWIFTRFWQVVLLVVGRRRVVLMLLNEHDENEHDSIGPITKRHDATYNSCFQPTATEHMNTY